jgi:hypothetical protein
VGPWELIGARLDRVEERRRPPRRAARPEDEVVTPKLLARHAAALYLGVSVRTFTRHVKPDLARVLVGKHPRYSVEELDRWVDEHKVAPLRAAHAVPTVAVVPVVPTAAPLRTSRLSPEAQAIVERLRRPSRARPTAPGTRRP